MLRPGFSLTLIFRGSGLPEDFLSASDLPSLTGAIGLADGWRAAWEQPYQGPLAWDVSLEDSALRNASTWAPESAPAKTLVSQGAGEGCVRLSPESRGQPPKTQPGREGACTDAAGECGGTRRASFPPQEHAPSPRLPPLPMPVLQSVTTCVNAKGQSGCPATLAPMSTPQPLSSACGQHRLFPSRWAPLETAEPGNGEPVPERHTQ